MSKLVVVLAALATAPFVSHRSTLQPGPDRLAFVIDLDASGGFLGQGRGGVTVESNGRVRASPISGGQRERSTCTTELAAGELDSLRRAVAAGGDRAWPTTFAPEGDNGCCDRHTWRLRLRGEPVQARATMWYDGNEKHLSKDVAVIRDVAVRALTRALANCGRK